MQCFRTSAVWFSKPGLLCSRAQAPGMYMQVETRTSTLLHLKRAPGIRSWSLLVGKLPIFANTNLK